MYRLLDFMFLKRRTYTDIGLRRVLLLLSVVVCIHHKLVPGEGNLLIVLYMWYYLGTSIDNGVPENTHGAYKSCVRDGAVRWWKKALVQCLEERAACTAEATREQFEGISRSCTCRSCWGDGVP